MKFDGMTTFFLTVGVGIITYSIPFIWNAYQKVISLKEKEARSDIEKIISDEVYGRTLRGFERCIQYPVGVLVFVLLMFIPFFSFGFGLFFLTIIFIYFLMIPAIFNKIIKKYTLTNKKLIELISLSELKFENVIKIFRELWGYNDNELEKGFNTNVRNIFVVFSKEIEKLLQEGHLNLGRIIDLLNDYEKHLSKRNIIYIVVYKEVFPKILEWHYAVWKEEYKLIGKNETGVWSNYNEISEKLDMIIRSTMERSLNEGHAYSFFESLEKHIKKYKNEKIDGAKHPYLYLENLPIYQEFFENIDKSSDTYDIWNHYFSKEWKVTIENYKKEIVSRIWFNKFFSWANGNIGRENREIDKSLDEVARGLFPEVSPIKWALILAYFSISWGDSRMKALIEWKRNFGFSMGGPVFWEGEEADIDKKFEEYINKTDEKTYELAAFLFKNGFTEINKYIAELKDLVFQYKNYPEKETRRREILQIFEGIKKYL